MDKILVGEILEPGDPDQQSEREARVKKGFWATVKRAAGRIPFMEDVVAAYYCVLDPETPTRARGILLAALAYFVLPIDLLPDFIAGFGFTDDLAVLSAAIAAVKTSINPVHYLAARKALNDEDSAS